MAAHARQAWRVPTISEPPPFFPEQEVKICMVGSTGSGKSAFGNFLFSPRREDYYDPGGQEFKTGEDQQSCTSKCEIKTVGGLHIMDTPGLNESASKDFQHVLHVVKTLESFERLNAVILVMKFESRMDTQWKQTVQAYQKLLGKEIFDRNLILVLTGFDPSSPKYRSAYVSAKVEDVKKVNANVVKDLLGLRSAPLIWAINSMPDPENKTAKAVHEVARNEILEYITRQHPVSVRGAKVPKTKEMQQDDALVAEKLEGKIEALHERFKRLEAVPKSVREEVCSLEVCRQSLLADILRLMSDIKMLDTDEDAVANQCTSRDSSWTFQDGSATFSLKAPGVITKATYSVSSGAEMSSYEGGTGARYFKGKIVKTDWVTDISCEVKIYCRKKDLHEGDLEKLRDRLVKQQRDADEFSSRITERLARYPDLEGPLFELRQEIMEKEDEVNVLRATHLTIPEAEQRLRQMSP